MQIPSNQLTLQCPRCGAMNRDAARFCGRCGAALLPSGPSRPDFLSDFKRVLDRTVSLIPPFIERVSQALRPASVLPQIPSKMSPGELPQQLLPRKVGERIGYLFILEVIPQAHTTRLVYYWVRSIYCPNCRQEFSEAAEKCPSCGTLLPEYLLRESLPCDLPATQAERDQILELSRMGLPGVLQHLAMFELNGNEYILLELPRGMWQGLAYVPLPQPQEVAVAWCVYLGQVLAWLHSKNLYFVRDTISDPRQVIIILNNQTACFADLTTCHHPARTEDAAAEKQKDIRFLTKTLYLLLTGNELRANTAGTPPVLQEIIEKARLGEYDSIQKFVIDLSRSPAPVELKRGLRQTVGYATDVGRTRDHNEDFLGTYSFGLEQKPGAMQLGLYLVADGMGGHAAGERASQDAARFILNKVHELEAVPMLKGVTRPLRQAVTSAEVLRQAVDQANQMLYEARLARQIPDDRGTTITGVLIAGDSATAVNVGDSRTYLLRQGKLQQITKDHSLVAGLVAAGMISLEEARSHPQRNQIYRSLGEKAKVDVDLFPLVLTSGDALVVCSDGLWEMVTDQKIETIVKTAPTPQSACDQLIQAANAAGGEDNISVIIIRME